MRRVREALRDRAVAISALEGGRNVLARVRAAVNYVLGGIAARAVQRALLRAQARVRPHRARVIIWPRSVLFRRGDAPDAIARVPDCV